MEITHNNKKYLIGEMVEPNPINKLQLFDIITIFEVVEEDEHGMCPPILKPIDYFYKDREDIAQHSFECVWSESSTVLLLHRIWHIFSPDKSYRHFADLLISGRLKFLEGCSSY